MRPKKSKVEKEVKNYILETVYDANGKEFANIDDAKKHLVKEFIIASDHPYNLKTFPNHQNRFGDFLDGGPFNFPCYNFEFIDIVNSWGLNPENKEFPFDKTRKLFHAKIWAEIHKEYYKIKEKENKKIQKNPKK